MFIVINNLEQLLNFLDGKDISRPEEILEVLAEKDIVISPEVAQLVLEAA